MTNTPDIEALIARLRAEAAALPTQYRGNLYEAADALERTQAVAESARALNEVADLIADDDKQQVLGWAVDKMTDALTALDAKPEGEG